MSDKSLSPREELLQLQKNIFRRNDHRIRSEAMVLEPGFASYERCYRRSVSRLARPVEIEEVLGGIEKADIIYIGDYHTNPQAQRTLLRILKLVIGRGMSFALGIELVRDSKQASLDSYLRGESSERQLLGEIELKKYWYFDLWDNFKPIFDFSRYHKIPLYGIESASAEGKGLKVRDRESARIIAKILERRQEEKLFVFVGDLHVAPAHLPHEVDRELKRSAQRKKKLILYQNSEAVYWQLADRELEEKVEIVRTDRESFCFMNTPPIVWQQTYLNWLEHEGEAIDYADARQSFLELLTRIARFLEIDVPENAEDVEVFTCGNLSFLEAIARKGDFTARELKVIKRQILSSESYFIPRSRYVYLANLSINHASEEAAHYLKFLCSGEESPRSMVDAFYANTIHEALGFFGSKLINHKRKCSHEKNFRKMIKYLESMGPPSDRRLEMGIARFVLDHKKLEKRGESISYQRVLGQGTELFLGTTHALGQMLGDRLYHAMLAEVVSKKEISDLFRMPMDEEGEPFAYYIGLIGRTRRVKLPRRL